jgi:light-regulated signal transduction histidine kinase (bacteriophytochrome)
MSRHLAASCENLAAHARLTAANQETCDWPRSSITEFNNLAEDLESMAETIKGREEELQEKNEELTIAEEELRHLNDDLEGRVMERTAQLESANQEISSLNEDLTGRSNDLERTNRELAEVNHQLEAFSFSISHDLQAPLRHINGFSRILMEDHARDLSKDAQSLLERISAGCERMDQLINGLLRFSRFSRQPITKMTVETNSLVQQVVDELDLQQRPQAVELVLHELPSCQADRQLLRQVFQNLIGNALKYSANVTQPHIEIGSCLQEGQTIFFVRDNGVGFDMKYADKLFGVFQRLHKEEEFAGTGVGLSIVHNIITRHGGKVWAEAELNKGATFFFTL